MKILIVLLVILLGTLQYELWFSRNSIPHYMALKKTVALQQKDNLTIMQQNKALDLHIKSLKTGQEAVEEHARNDLGMIRQGETFYQTIGPQSNG